VPVDRLAEFVHVALFPAAGACWGCDLVSLPRSRAGRFMLSNALFCSIHILDV
jgi:hypothetical protein